MIDAATQVFAVMGNPVSHSLSPVMFNRAFSETGYNGVYVAFQVTAIGDGISAMRSLGIKGASITIPHKVSILDFLDEIDPMAESIGAVNTVISHEGRLKGYNSDCLGAIKALEEITHLEGKQVAIIGAGGAARAIGFGVKSRGAGLTLINRSISKGEILAAALEAEFIPISELRSLPFDMLIQTTSVGMTPHIHQSPVPAALLTPGLLVMDIVYAPLKTRLLKDAIEAGCRTINGLSMFIHQAAFQFELWTGSPAPLAVMKQSLMDSLNPSQKRAS
ncbi:MAG: shikimate dehydrogenase [Deltaproteobacteria bacterium]|nr:shikimate dehydrogenase [Deltaproteobacteria bacterium]